MSAFLQLPGLLNISNSEDRAILHSACSHLPRLSELIQTRLDDFLAFFTDDAWRSLNQLGLFSIQEFEKGTVRISY